MAKIIYLSDHQNGEHMYWPELGERKPEVKMEASLSYYGKHYIVDTPLELKGRGITENEAHWHKGSQKEREGWRSYTVTLRAYELLKQKYPIAREALLD